jgi:hypothetical protein
MATQHLLTRIHQEGQYAINHVAGHHVIIISVELYYTSKTITHSLFVTRLAMNKMIRSLQFTCDKAHRQQNHSSTIICDKAHRQKNHLSNVICDKAHRQQNHSSTIICDKAHRQALDD